MGWLFEKTFVVAKINLLFFNFVHKNTTFNLPILPPPPAAEPLLSKSPYGDEVEDQHPEEEPVVCYRSP